MFERLLVAVDQSEESDRAVAAARDLARLSHGTVRLVHVREAQVVIGKGGGVFDVEEPEEIERLLSKEIAVVEEAGIPVTSELRHAVVGRTALEIVAASEDCGADVIVEGRPGVFPVNYEWAEGRIVIRTDPGLKLDAATLTSVAFEIDEVDTATRSCWSNLVS